MLPPSVSRSAFSRAALSSSALRRRVAFDRRRAIVGAVLDAVVIGPARPGTHAFDRERVIDVRGRS